MVSVGLLLLTRLYLNSGPVCHAPVDEAISLAPKIDLTRKVSLDARFVGQDPDGKPLSFQIKVSSQTNKKWLSGVSVLHMDVESIELKAGTDPATTIMEDVPMDIPLDTMGNCSIPFTPSGLGVLDTLMEVLLYTPREKVKPNTPWTRESKSMTTTFEIKSADQYEGPGAWVISFDVKDHQSGESALEGKLLVEKSTLIPKSITGKQKIVFVAPPELGGAQKISELDLDCSFEVKEAKPLSESDKRTSLTALGWPRTENSSRSYKLDLDFMVDGKAMIESRRALWQSYKIDKDGDLVASWLLIGQPGSFMPKGIEYTCYYTPAKAMGIDTDEGGFAALIFLCMDLTLYDCVLIPKFNYTVEQGYLQGKIKLESVEQVSSKDCSIVDIQYSPGKGFLWEGEVSGKVWVDDVSGIPQKAELKFQKVKLPGDSKTYTGIVKISLVS